MVIKWVNFMAQLYIKFNNPLTVFSVVRNVHISIIYVAFLKNRFFYYVLLYIRIRRIIRDAKAFHYPLAKMCNTFWKINVRVAPRELNDIWQFKI